MDNEKFRRAAYAIAGECVAVRLRMVNRVVTLPHDRGGSDRGRFYHQGRVSRGSGQRAEGPRFQAAGTVVGLKEERAADVHQIEGIGTGLLGSVI